MEKRDLHNKIENWGTGQRSGGEAGEREQGNTREKQETGET